MALIQKIESSNGNDFVTFSTPGGNPHRGASLVGASGEHIGIAGFPIISSVTGDVEVIQPTHDDLNANANIQVGNADASSSNPVPISNTSSGTQKTIISRYLDTVGDGSGSKNANGNYSGAEEIFFCQPGAGEILRVSRIIISIEDGQGFRAERYGAINSALSTGITLRTANDSGALVDFTDALPIQTNAGWGALCYDVDVKTWGAGNEFLVARFTFSKSGQFVRLVGDDNERLEAVFNDNLTGLVNHNFILQGYME
jgi:hypothetical protein